MHPSGRSDEKSTVRAEPKGIVYHPEALDELIKAARYYESCSPGLGNRFLDTVENATKFIGNNPYVFAEDDLGRRKFVIKNFPYIIIFKVRENSLFILAVAHGKRKPDYWEPRDE